MSHKKMQHNDQFIISPELLRVLHWLLKYESEPLLDLIIKSFVHGVSEDLEDGEQIDHLDAASQSSIVEFLQL